VERATTPWPYVTINTVVCNCEQADESGRRALVSQISSHFYAASNISPLSTKTRLHPAFCPRKLRLRLKLKLKVKAFLLLKVRCSMPASASFQDGVDFLPSFLSIRPSTFTALLLLASIWIYVYTRKAIKYRVRTLLLDNVWIFVD
jgi:hypothetical protein